MSNRVVRRGTICNVTKRGREWLVDVCFVKCDCKDAPVDVNDHPGDCEAWRGIEEIAWEGGEEPKPGSTLTIEISEEDDE